MMTNKRNTIKQNGSHNLAIQDSEVTVIVSAADELYRLGREGNIEGAAMLMKQMNDAMGSLHPFYPHYRYKAVNVGNTVFYEHEPVSKASVEKYPLSFKGKFNLKKDQVGEHKNFNELLESAFLKQENIEVDMVSLQAWIGNQPVETPLLDKTIKDSKYFITPKPLPAPMKLKFYLKDKKGLEITIIDYLEMDISNIDRKSNVVEISNSNQQNSRLLVILQIPISEKSEAQRKFRDAKINIKIKKAYRGNVRANKDFLYFLSVSKKNNDTIALKNLETNTDFMISKEFVLNGNYEELQQDYNFIQRLYALEQHYQVIFILPEIFSDEDYKNLNILEKTMKHEKITRTLNWVTFNLEEKETLVNIVNAFEKNNEVTKFAFVSTSVDSNLEVLGAIIPIEKFITVYNTITLENIEKVKRKLSDMDEGDVIKVKMIPGNDNEIEEIYEFRIK